MRDESASGANESRVCRLKARLSPARDATKRLLHKCFPRWLLRAFAWAGLVWLPEAVLATLARRGTTATVIISPEDHELFSAMGGRTAVRRLQRSARPPRLIATATGDHSANHPAILAAIRDAVLPVAARVPQVASK